MSSSEPSLTRRVVAGGIWGMLGSSAQTILGLAAAIVVARHLLPADYAVMALAGAVVSLTGRIGSFGLVDAIVREREEFDDLAESVFTALVGLGLLLCGAVLAATPLLAVFYDEPRLTRALPVLLLSLYAGMLGSVPRALLQRGLRFREINLLDVIQKAVASVVGIGLAVAGFGYWALILPSLVAIGAISPALFLMAGFRPHFGFSWPRLRRCVRFSSGVFLARLLNFLGDDIDYFVLGKYLARPAYGFYYFAFTRTRMPYTLLGPAIQGPLLPAFSELRHDARRLRRAVVRVASISFSTLAPISLALAIFADPLIPFVFSDRWAPAVPLCRVFAILTLLPAAGGFSGAVLLALGRSWTVVGFNAFRLAAIGTALAWGVLGSRTALEIAVSLTAANFLTIGTTLFLLFSLIGLRGRDYVTMYGRAALCIALAVAAWGSAFAAGLQPENLGSLLYLAAAGSLFLAAYGAATWWINRPPVDEVLPLIRERLKRRFSS